MPNQSLVDLTARTATADTDLIHVNSVGTDYKQTKQNFLRGNLAHQFANNSTLTSQLDTLASAIGFGTVHGDISSNGHQTETGMPVNSNGTVFARIFSVGQMSVSFFPNATSDEYVIYKQGTWGTWEKQPTRSEISALNNSLMQSSGSVSPSVGSGSIDYFKFGNVVTIKIGLNNLTISQDTTVATLPSAIRPRVDLDFVEPISNGRCFITSAGLLKPQFSLTNGILRGAFTYVI